MASDSLNPVLITGVGVVSAAGEDLAATRARFDAGERSPSTTMPFESSIQAPTFQVSADLPELPGRFNQSRTLRLAMRAIREGLRDSGIDRFGAATRVGICLGTTVACQLNSVPFYAAYRRWKEVQPETPPPKLDAVQNFLQANLAQAVATLLSVTGPRMTIVNACSSGTDAIGVAASWIRAGVCDVAIAGGADELNRVPVAGFWSLGVMSTEPCRPFDRDRSGLNLGEGAGIMVLESQGHAKERGRAAEFAVAGFGAACDAHHLTAPHPEGRGLHRAIDTALEQARCTANEIAVINAHGTATLDNDRAEAAVIARKFGASRPFLSTKGYTGHTLGAAGGVEAVFTLLALRDGWIPRSAGFDAPSGDIAVTPVREKTRITGDVALSTSLAFGGNNAALVIGRAR